MKKWRTEKYKKGQHVQKKYQKWDFESDIYLNLAQFIQFHLN